MATRPTMRNQLSLLLGKIETTRGVDAGPTAADDAFLVSDLDYQLDPTPLERNNFQRSFSPTPNPVGRKVVNLTFNHEIKGSGDATARSALGKLLRACGMSETQITAGAANQIETPVRFGSVQGPDVTWSKDTAPDGSHFGSYLLKVVTGGGSSTAAIRVYRWEQSQPDDSVLPTDRYDARVNDSATATLTLDASDLTSLDFTVGGTVTAGDDLYAVVGGLTFRYTVQAGDASTDDIASGLAALIDADARLSASAASSVVTVTFSGNAAATVVTSGTTEITLGDSGAGITPTWTGNLVEGQEWVVTLYEEAFMYQPTSDNDQVETMTLYVYKDGVLHKITSCMGTVTFTGESGGLGQAQFEMQGNYIDPVEEPIPLDADLEQTTPPQVELAQMSIAGDQDFCAQSFTFTLGNQLNLRECMNAQDGYDGTLITDREPTAQLNPDATYEAYTGMWGNFSRTTQFPLHLRVGTEAGNTVRFYTPRANFTGLTYGDRNGITTIEAEFQLNGLSKAGDDELRVVFV